LKRKSIKLVLGFVLIVFFSQFQNCAETAMEFKDVAVSNRLSYFNFHYTEASPVYLDSKVILPQTEVTGSRLLKAVAIATPSNGTLEILEYRLRFQDVNGVLLCPVVQGNLLSGSNLIEGSCSVTGNAKLKKLIFRVRYAGVWYVQEHDYGPGI